MRRKKLSLQQKKCEMLCKLNVICLEMELRWGERQCLQRPDVWPKTRDLADSCGESIYMARSILLQLVEEGKVIKHSSLLLKSLRWYINKSHGFDHINAHYLE